MALYMWKTCEEKCRKAVGNIYLDQSNASIYHQTDNRGICVPVSPIYPSLVTTTASSGCTLKIPIFTERWAEKAVT